MKIELTRRGDYAIRALLALARTGGGVPLSVPRIAAAHGIPPRYLAAIMSDLLREELVVAVPGRRGGYRLARPAARITVLDVLQAVEGPFERMTCVLRGGPCDLDNRCDVHDVFAAAEHALGDVLAGASLAGLPVGGDNEVVDSDHSRRARAARADHTPAR